jgi:hypothetical protein
MKGPVAGVVGQAGGKPAVDEEADQCRVVVMARRMQESLTPRPPDAGPGTFLDEKAGGLSLP